MSNSRVSLERENARLRSEVSDLRARLASSQDSVHIFAKQHIDRRDILDGLVFKLCSVLGVNSFFLPSVPSDFSVCVDDSQGRLHVTMVPDSWAQTVEEFVDFCDTALERDIAVDNSPAGEVVPLVTYVPVFPSVVA